MNRKQRMILIIGAAAFLYVILTSPKISIVKGTYITASSDQKNIAKIVDVRTAMIRAIAVLGATLLVSAALKDTYKPPLPSPSDKNATVGDCQESQPQAVKRDVIAKIIKFLKDFF